MFVNLVHIELIRLIRNRSLKFSIPTSLFMLICCVGVAEFGFDRMVAVRLEFDNTIYGAEVMASLILGFYEIGALLVAAVSTIFATCDYSKYRLAINIEGVERNRLKLYLSEISGILIFVLISCLIGIPVAVIGSLFGGQGSVLASEGRSELLMGYLSVALTFAILSGIVCVTGYLFSRLFKSKAVSFTFVGVDVFVFLILVAVAVGFVQGVNEASNSAVNIEDIVGITLLVFSLIPLVASGIVLAIKERKSDRI